MKGAHEGIKPESRAEELFYAANRLREEERFAEAEQLYREAIAIVPDLLEALNNLGLVLRSQGRIREAIDCYTEALGIDPECAEAHFNRGLCRLLLGDFERGWPEYEWRLKIPGNPPRIFHRPSWDGTPLNGRTILLRADQGFGDTIHFIRYAPLLRAQGGRVLLECQPALATLLEDAPGVDDLVPRGEDFPPFDVHAPLLSLPWLFRTSLETIPARVPYLEVDSRRREAWEERVEDGRDFKVGFSWEGNPGHPEFRRRSAPLELFRPLAGLPGVRLFSLQKRMPAPPREGTAPDAFFQDLEPYLHDFAETAAAIGEMDLVIATDSAVAHLAGALGKPVWVFLQFAADWRWILGRDDSPWYPTMRLFRQEKAGEWRPVFRRIEAELSALRSRGAFPPETPETLFQRARSCAEGGRFEEGAALYREVLRRRPEAAPAHCNLGIALKTLDRLEEAGSHLEEAVRLEPRFAEAWNSLGNVRFALRRYEEARACHEEAIRLEPDFREAHINLGCLHLALGDFGRGWEEYSWRLCGPEFAARLKAAPLWDGSPLAGRRILLWAEQGFGDTLHFIRYAKLVKERGGRTVVECPPALVRLLATAPGVDELVPAGSPLPSIHAQAPLMSLPRILRTTLSTIPAEVPYLAADPELSRAWSTRLTARCSLKVGVCWQGNPKHPSSRRKSVPSHLLFLLAENKKVRLFGLQKGCPGPLVEDLSGHLSDFAETAAAIAGMDLVISVDSAVAHLAGALGKPVWTLLPYSAEWRWGTEGERSPWYPTMRLLRQPRPGDWESVLRKVAEGLCSPKLGP